MQDKDPADTSPPSYLQIRRALSTYFPSGMSILKLKVVSVTKKDVGWNIAGFIEYHSSAKKANYFVDFEGKYVAGRITDLTLGDRQYSSGMRKLAKNA